MWDGTANPYRSYDIDDKPARRVRGFTSLAARVDLQQRFAKAARLAIPGAQPAPVWPGAF